MVFDVVFICIYFEFIFFKKQVSSNDFYLNFCKESLRDLTCKTDNTDNK